MTTKCHDKMWQPNRDNKIKQQRSDNKTVTTTCDNKMWQQNVTTKCDNKMWQQNVTSNVTSGSKTAHVGSSGSKTTHVGCQDEKMQTLEHFWAAKMRKCKHENIFCAAKMRKCKHYSIFGLPRWEQSKAKAKQKATKTRALYIQTPDQPPKRPLC